MFFDIVVARSYPERIIGKNGTLPWSLPEDLAHFKTLTRGGVVILGRRTWESLPGRRPLPDRIHVVVSKTLTLPQGEGDTSSPGPGSGPGPSPSPGPNVLVARSFQEALSRVADSGRPVFVIGGASLYMEALASPWCRRVVETVVHTTVPCALGDTIVRFPDIPPTLYTKTNAGAPMVSATGLSYEIHTWTRRRPLLWWIDKSCYESEWLTDVCLKDTATYEVQPALAVIPNAIIISNQLHQYHTLLNLYESTGTPFSLIHLSDEYLDDDTHAYSMKQCRQVFRNYLHPYHLKNPKVLTFGIGFRNGMRGAGLDSLRPYIWSFAGYIKKSDRSLICSLFQSFQPNKIHETTGFNQGILPPDQYGALLRQSHFVLCPVGNCSIDTFRLYEALEAGAIPITLYTNVNQPFVRFISHYWGTLFGTQDLPFIISHSWEENVRLLRDTVLHPDRLNQLKERARVFWATYCADLRNQFTKKLNS
jgi:dihydrofolate reductase